MNHAIKHILLPVDFSGYSNDAFRFALDLAKKNGSTINMLHVVEPPYNFATAIEGMTQIMEKNAISKMDQMINNIQTSEYEDVEINTGIKHGRTTRELLERIKKNSVDVVVMGSKGQSGLDRAVFGSVSTGIIADSTVPVFVIPEDDKSENLNIENILFTTNLREKDPENLSYVDFIASLYDAKIELIHITKHNDFESSLRVKGFIQLINDLNLDSTPELMVKEHKNFLISLAEYLSENPASLVVLNRYRRSIVQKLFAKDHTSDMIEYYQSPLLVIP